MFVGHPILDEIRQGCRLRPTKTIDKSRPIILVEGESLNPMLSQRRDLSSSASPPQPPAVGDMPPPPPPASIPPAPPLAKKQQHLKPVTNPALLKLGGKIEVDRDELMRAIRGGVRLRKVTTNDKSAPLIDEYEGVTRSRSSRGSSPLGNEYQSDDAYESAQSSLSPLSTSPELRNYRPELGTLVQNTLQRSEEPATVIARPAFIPKSASFNSEPPYAVATVAAPPPPPPPPPPLPTWAAQSSTPVNSHALQTICGDNETAQNKNDTATGGTLKTPKKADEHYTSPIPTREMIEAEIPTGSASNRIKLLNSLHNRAQSHSPIRRLNRSTIQRNVQSNIFPTPQQSQQTTPTIPDSDNRPADFTGGKVTNRSFSDVNSIKKMAQRFDSISKNAANVNSSNGTCIRPMKILVSDGTLQASPNDTPAKIVSPINGTQRPIPGKWMPPRRSFIANKQQPSQSLEKPEDEKTHKPTARQFSVPKTLSEETSPSNMESIPAKPVTNKTVSKRWPPEQPSFQKTAPTRLKHFISNSEQTDDTVTACSKPSESNSHSQLSQEGGPSFLKSQDAQSGTDFQHVSTIQRPPSSLQHGPFPSTARSPSPTHRVPFPSRFTSPQTQPASVAARRSSFERVSSPVPLVPESGVIRRSASPIQRPQSPPLRTASPVLFTPRYGAAQRSDSNSSTAQYAQVHQVAPASHTAQSTSIQRIYASTHNAPVADVEPSAVSCLSTSTIATGDRVGPRSTELSILPPSATTVPTPTPSKYATPIRINTDEMPPPVPTTEPPNVFHIPVQVSSSGTVSSSKRSFESSTKTGTGPYRYVKESTNSGSITSGYSRPSSQSLMSPTNTTRSDVSLTELCVSSEHSPGSVSPISASTSSSYAPPQCLPNRSLDNHIDSIGVRQGPVGASDDEQRNENVIDEPVYSLPTPRTISIRDKGVCSTGPPVEQVQEDNGERQCTTNADSHSSPQIGSLKAQKIDSKTYSIPINAPWYTPEVGKAEPTASDTTHYAGSRTNNPLSHQGVGRAHRIIIGASDQNQQQQLFENENPETLRNSFKFTIDLESDEPLKMVQR